MNRDVDKSVVMAFRTCVTTVLILLGNRPRRTSAQISRVLQEGVLVQGSCTANSD